MIEWISLPGSLLADALSRASVSCADRGNPRWGALNAICLLFEKDLLSVIGTDQHRASIINVAIPGSTIEKRILVNPDAVVQAAKMFDGNVELGVGANNITIRSGKNAVLTRLVGGNYPDVKKFIPKHPNLISLPVSDFQEHVKRAYLAIDERKAMRLQIKPNELVLSSQTRENRREVTINYKLAHNSAPITVAINGEYLVQLMKILNDGKTVDMAYKSNQEPLLFSQSNLKHLMVPLETR